MKPKSLRILEDQIALKLTSILHWSEMLPKCKKTDVLYRMVSQLHRRSLEELFSLLEILKLEEPEEFKKYEEKFKEVKKNLNEIKKK